MDKTIIKSHRDVISLLGGNHELAGKLIGDYEKLYQKVRKWNERNRIPPDYWRELIDVAREQDLTLTCWELVETQGSK